MTLGLHPSITSFCLEGLVSLFKIEDTSNLYHFIVYFRHIAVKFDLSKEQMKEEAKYPSCRYNGHGTNWSTCTIWTMRLFKLAPCGMFFESSLSPNSL